MRSMVMQPRPSSKIFLSVTNKHNVAQQIHVKGNNPATIPALLPKLQGISNYILTSFDLELIKEIKNNDITVPVGWIVKPHSETGSEGLEDLTAKVSGGGIDFPGYTDLELKEIILKAKYAQVNIVLLCGPRIKNKEMIEQVRTAGLGVGAWGVGSNLALARQLIEFGIDRFTLDNPEQLID